MYKLNRKIWKDWTPLHFIEYYQTEIALIMSGNSRCHAPFHTATEMTNYIKKTQPFYEDEIPELYEYFENQYFKKRSKKPWKNGLRKYISISIVAFANTKRVVTESIRATIAFLIQ